MNRALRQLTAAARPLQAPRLLPHRLPARLLSSAASSSSSPSAIEDEYQDIAHESAASGVFALPTPLQLESGEQLPDAQVAYTTYGSLNAARDNVIVLCHALTGHSLAHQYWNAMVTPAWTDKYFVVCSNILGSCYGSTGPTSVDPRTGKRYGARFPAVTLRDAVSLQKRLLVEHLGVRQVQAVVGGSLGGMQTLEWAFEGPEFVKRFVAIACNSHHSAWQIGMSELQRQAIYMDPLFHGGDYDPDHPPTQGLSLARQIAMMSYRTHAAYMDKFGRKRVADAQAHADAKHGAPFLVQSYLAHQGEKFLSRFDVNSYMTLMHMMDTHDVGRGRGGIANALATLTQPALVVGVESDVLYPLSEQREIAEQLPNAQFVSLGSPHGHDGFLLGQDEISDLTMRFLAEN